MYSEMEARTRQLRRHSSGLEVKFGPLDQLREPQGFCRPFRTVVAVDGPKETLPPQCARKNDAVRIAKALGMCVAACDTNAHGDKAYYAVPSWERAYDRLFHRKYPGQWAYLYEGMLANYPIKLILDLEFSVPHNLELATEEHLDRLTLLALELATALLHRLFDFEPKLEDWIVLDASYLPLGNPKKPPKSSRHTILNAQGRFFRSMHDALRFLHMLRATMAAAVVRRDPRLLPLMVKMKKPKTSAASIAEQVQLEDGGPWYTCFIDWGIYNTTFRLMRTYGACKSGEEHRPLRVAKMNRQHHPDDQAYFHQTLLSNVTPPDGPGWAIDSSEKTRYIRAVHSFSTYEVCDARLLRMLKGRHTTKAKGISSQPFRSHTSGGLQWPGTKVRPSSEVLATSDARYRVILRILQTRVPVLCDAPLFRETPNWTIHPAQGKSGIAYYAIRSPSSSWCPLVKDHHGNVGKWQMTLGCGGGLRIRCHSGRCRSESSVSLVSSKLYQSQRVRIVLRFASKTIS